jgi:hypothetical protein
LFTLEYLGLETLYRGSKDVLVYVRVKWLIKFAVKAFQTLVSGEDDELSTAYEDFHKAVGRERGAVLNTTLAVVGQLEKGSTGIQADVRETLLIVERTDLNTRALMASTEQLNKSFCSMVAFQLHLRLSF